MRRAERFLKLGADGIFIAGLRTEEDYRRVGAAFRGSYCSAAMFEGGDTPWLSPAELGDMGFMQVSYPASLIFRVVAALRDGLEALRKHADGTADAEADGERRGRPRYIGPGRRSRALEGDRGGTASGLIKTAAIPAGRQ